MSNPNAASEERKMLRTEKTDRQTDGETGKERDRQRQSGVGKDGILASEIIHQQSAGSKPKNFNERRELNSVLLNC